MDSRHEKLLEAFEEFELDLEVEDILKKVKVDLVLDDEDIREFGEQLLEERRRRRQAAQAAQAVRAARATRFHQLCYPQLTCDWFVEGLDYCWNNWHHKFKRPLTPPPAPPPSPHVCRKRGPPPQSPSQPPSQTPSEVPTKQR